MATPRINPGVAIAATTKACEKLRLENVPITFIAIQPIAPPITKKAEGLASSPSLAMKGEYPIMLAVKNTVTSVLAIGMKNESLGLSM